MVEVRLHGDLARQFGKLWHFDIASPAEAVRALECARKGFKAAIMNLAQRGMVFRVRTKNHDYGNEDVAMVSNNLGRIDIIPIVAGASAGVRFVIGAVLTVAGFLLLPAFPILGPMLMSAGISMMLGAVTEWLTPKPQRPDDQKGSRSWTIDGPSNTVQQGLPVPVIYGNVLVGGYVISAGISAAQVSPGGSVQPAVNIGGQSEIIAYGDGAATMTVEVRLGASAFNLEDPLEYTWTKSGFAMAASATLVTSTQGVLLLRLVYNTAPNSYATDTGTVSVSLIGRESFSRDERGPGQRRTVNASKAVSVTLHNIEWVAS